MDRSPGWRKSYFIFRNEKVQLEIKNLGVKDNRAKLVVHAKGQLFKKIFKYKGDVFLFTIEPGLSMEEQSFDFSNYDNSQLAFLNDLHDALQWICFDYIA